MIIDEIILFRLNFGLKSCLQIILFYFFLMIVEFVSPVFFFLVYSRQNNPQSRLGERLNWAVKSSPVIRSIGVWLCSSGLICKAGDAAGRCGDAGMFLLSERLLSMMLLLIQQIT
jgi:hypothetical protein